jgi:hypothetical protein
MERRAFLNGRYTLRFEAVADGGALGEEALRKRREREAASAAAFLGGPLYAAEADLVIRRC